MKRIGLLSDTHGYLDQRVFEYFDACDEIWHAGDVGPAHVTDSLQDWKPLRAVYGNIDGQDIRISYPETLLFNCEGLDVLMTHIGGYPGRYSPSVREMLEKERPGLFVCGHSHILKIMFDKKYNCLHINPGAAGNHGFHKVKTMVRFAIDAGEIKELEIVELGNRG